MNDSTGQTERTWRAIISGKNNAFNWLVATFLGAMSISLSPAQTATRFLLPVAIIVVYLWLTYPRDLPSGLAAARVAQLADSVYFLGFLWTLWALIDSFVLKQQEAPEAAFRIFGYALVTTAFGMATRLWLLQFRYSPMDQIGEAQFSVERNLQNFSSAMQDVSESVRAFQKTTEALSNHIVQASKELEGLNKQFATTHRETTDVIRTSITTTVEEIRAALKSPVQEYGRAIRAFTSNVNTQSDILVESVGQTSTKSIEAIATATDTIRNMIESTGKRIASDQLLLADKLHAPITELLREFERLKEGVESAQHLNQFFAGLQPTLTKIAEMLSSNGPLRSNLAHLADEVSNTGEKANNAIAVFAGKLENFDVPNKMENDISQLARSIRELQDALDGLLIRAKDNRWDDLAQNASEAIRNLDRAVKNLEAGVNAGAVRTSRWPRIFR